MKLWILDTLDIWSLVKFSYDYTSRFLIRAESEQRARQIAAENSTREDNQHWLDPEKSSCKPLEIEGEEMVLMAVYYEG